MAGVITEARNCAEQEGRGKAAVECAQVGLTLFTVTRGSIVVAFYGIQSVPSSRREEQKLCQGTGTSCLHQFPCSSLQFLLHTLETGTLERLA